MNNFWVIAGKKSLINRSTQTYVDKNGFVNEKMYGRKIPKENRFCSSYKECKDLILELQSIGYSSCRPDPEQEFECEDCGIIGSLEWDFYTKEHLSYHGCVCGSRYIKEYKNESPTVE